MTDPFQILATEYRPMVLAYLRSMMKDDHLAEDLTQETSPGVHLQSEPATQISGRAGLLQWNVSR